MAITYEPISTTTLSSAAASVTFSSISGSYTDLVLIMNKRTDASRDIYVRFNGDTGSNYSRTYVYGNGSSAASGRDTNYGSFLLDYSTTVQSVSIHSFMNYSNSTTFKTVIGRYGPSDLAAIGVVGLWRNTNAITSMEIGCWSAGTLSSGSTFSLYGIKSA